MIKFNKKSQSAIEFIILICFVVFMFGVFLMIINEKYSIKVREDQDRVLNKVINDISDEISLASKADDGYLRQFKVPENIIGKSYSIELSEGFVYAKTDDLKSSAAVPAFNVSGNIKKGYNTIKKDGGIVYLNN